MREDRERGWVWNVAVVWVAVVIAMIGMSLVMPFLPLYLRELGVADRETKLWAGWIGGVNFLCAALFAPLWGTFADRYGRKPMAIRALIGLAVSVGLMGFCHNVYQLFGLRVLQGMFGGFVAESIALVATSVPKERVGSCLGFLQTGVVGGNFIGPLVGSGLSLQFGYRSTFRITGLALVAAMLLIFFLVRERRGAAPQEKRRGVVASVRELLAIPRLRWMVAVVSLSQCGMMLINPQISLFVEELVHGPTAVKWWTGLVTALPALGNAAMAPLWGRLGDRHGHARMLSLALGCAALIVPWTGLTAVVWQLAALRVAMGAFTSALNPSAHSVVAHTVDERRMAGAFSLVSSAQMLGSCAGPFLSGPLATTFGVRPLFPATGILLFLAALAAVRVRTAAAEGLREGEKER